MAEHRPARILVIDDDPLILETIQTFLDGEGYEVSTHQGAFGGAAIIADTRPDLVLLDIDMPGLSGPGLAEVVGEHADLADTRIFFFSGGEEEAIAKAARECGVDGYIRKGDLERVARDVARALLR